MITAIICKDSNYSLLAVIDQFNNIVKGYIVTDGEDSQTFYSYSKACKRFDELTRGLLN